MPIHKNGFSLVEMLIALAVSAIIIAAAFGSYAMIARNFDFQKDMKYIAQSARAVVDMINSDIRLAGYTAVDNGAIANAVMLSDSGTAACCDAISVIYDQTPTERRQVTYYTKQYTSDDTRFRLYKHICQVSTPYTIAQIQAGQCPATATLLAENPIADYVEDLQFLGSRGDCAPGDVEYGCGAVQEVTPISGTYYNNVSSVCNDNVLEIFDGNVGTYWDCRQDTGQFNHSGFHHIKLKFAEEFRPTKIVINGSLGGVDGGSFNDTGIGYQIYNVSNGNYYLEGGVHPYGTNTSIGMILRFLRDGSDTHSGGIDWKCVAPNDTYCTPGDTYDTFAYSPQYNQSTSWLSNGLVQSFTVKPKSQTTWDLGTITSNDHILSLSSSKYLTIEVNSSNKAFLCAYDSSSTFWVNGDIPNKCNVKTAGSGGKRQITIPDMKIYGEVYGGAISATEIETSILIRSPNEHGNVDRSVGSPLTLGNRTNSWSDKHLRDSFTTATVVRNLYYSSQ